MGIVVACMVGMVPLYAGAESPLPPTIEKPTSLSIKRIKRLPKTPAFFQNSVKQSIDTSVFTSGCFNEKAITECAENFMNDVWENIYSALMIYDPTGRLATALNSSSDNQVIPQPLPIENPKPKPEPTPTPVTPPSPIITQPPTPIISQPVPVPPTGQEQHYWNPYGRQSGLMSWINSSDSGSDRIKELDRICDGVKSGMNVWEDGAGDRTNKNFGFPVASKCEDAKAGRLSNTTPYMNSGDMNGGFTLSGYRAGMYDDNKAWAVCMDVAGKSADRVMVQDALRSGRMPAWDKLSPEGQTTTAKCEGPSNYGGYSSTACNFNNKCEYGESSGSCSSDCGSNSVMSNYQSTTNNSHMITKTTSSGGNISYYQNNSDSNLCGWSPVSQTIPCSDPQFNGSGSTGSYASCPAGFQSCNGNCNTPTGTACPSSAGGTTAGTYTYPTATSPEEGCRNTGGTVIAKSDGNYCKKSDGTTEWKLMYSQTSPAPTANILDALRSLRLWFSRP